MQKEFIEYGMKMFKHSSGKYVITAGILTDLTGPDDCGYVRGCNLLKGPEYTQYDHAYSPILQLTLFAFRPTLFNPLEQSSHITKKLHDHIKTKHKGILALCFPGRMRKGMRDDFYCHFTFAFDGNEEFASGIFNEIENHLKYLYNIDHDIKKKMDDLSRESEQLRDILGLDMIVNTSYVADVLRELKEKAQKFDKLKNVLRSFMD